MENLPSFMLIVLAMAAIYAVVYYIQEKKLRTKFLTDLNQKDASHQSFLQRLEKEHQREISKLVNETTSLYSKITYLKKFEPAKCHCGRFKKKSNHECKRCTEKRSKGKVGGIE